jgi:hypothetical protein
MFRLTTGLETAEPIDHRLKPGAKINISYIKLIFSGVLSQQWKAE